jgi:hypothetical protein
MYTGGYSAVVDASKFFYQFLTHPDDHPNLGLRHPLTNEIYEYWGLPMGAANSPALAGRYGLSFVRMLKARFGEFQGTPLANCWWTGFSEMGEYDPNEGYGYVLTDESGSPAVKVWVHVDDFLIHGDTYDKTAHAWNALPPKEDHATSASCEILWFSHGFPRHSVPPYPGWEVRKIAINCRALDRCPC